MHISLRRFSYFRVIGSLELPRNGMWSEQMIVGGLLMQGFSETVALVGFTRLGSERILWEFSQICERKHLVTQLKAAYSSALLETLLRKKSLLKCTTCQRLEE